MLEGRKRLSYGLFSLLLLLVIGAGRGTMTVYNNVSVDIAYASWVADLFQYATDLLNGAKIALSYGAIAYAVCCVSKQAGNTVMFLCLGGLLIENAARFLIDYFSSGLSYYGIPLAVITLSLRFLYEGAFVLAARFIAGGVLRRIRKVSGESEKKKMPLPIHGARISVLVFLAAQVLGEISYLADHIRTYGGMTSQEIAVCIGSFLNLFVMYGGVPLLLCEVVFWLMPRLTLKKQ